MSSSLAHRRSIPAVSHAEAFEGLRSDYSAAKASRFRRRRTGLNTIGTGADYHDREVDHLRVMEFSRDIDRNDCVVGQMIDRAVTHTIQGGFDLTVTTGDAGLDKENKARWTDWAGDREQVEAQGEFTFSDLEYLTFRHTLIDGDILHTIFSDGMLQTFEGHRIRSPQSIRRKNVVCGVELSPLRKRLAYFLTKEDISPTATVRTLADVERVPARAADDTRQVFHIYDPKRISQTRGVGALLPIFDLVGMHDDTQFAAVLKQQISACFVLFRERDIAFDTAGSGAATGDLTTETTAGGSSRVIQGISPGLEMTTLPGEKYSGFSPNVLGPDFFMHVKMILSLLSVNLGMPYAMTMIDASDTNYSGWRGAMEQARIGFRLNQKWMIERFHSPIYRAKVRQWWSDDAAMRNIAQKNGVDMYGHTWRPPTWPNIDPIKDATDRQIRRASGQASGRDIQAEIGRDAMKGQQTIYEEEIEDNGYGIKLAMAMAKTLNAGADDADRVSWRDCICLPTKDMAQISITASADPTPEPTPAKPVRAA